MVGGCNCKLSKQDTNYYSDVKLYHSIVGASQYATITRLEISCCQQGLSFHVPTSGMPLDSHETNPSLPQRHCHSWVTPPISLYFLSAGLYRFFWCWLNVWSWWQRFYFWLMLTPDPMPLHTSQANSHGHTQGGNFSKPCPKCDRCYCLGHTIDNFWSLHGHLAQPMLHKLLDQKHPSHQIFIRTYLFWVTSQNLGLLVWNAK